jgi:hypothetical protein
MLDTELCLSILDTSGDVVVEQPGHGGVPQICVKHFWAKKLRALHQLLDL